MRQNLTKEASELTRYRSFRNDDPPALANVWRSQPPTRGLAQEVLAEMFERYVMSKPYFDRHGLIVAEDNGKVVGFAHAGFAWDALINRPYRRQGTTCLVLVLPCDNEAEIAAELLNRSEAYLQAEGAETVFGGPMAPVDPFYWGLYGGSELPGILDSDTRQLAIFQAAGYEPADQCIVFQRDVAGYRPAVDRKQMRLRRQYQVEAVDDPKAHSWWDACKYCLSQRTRYALSSRDGEICGQVDVWDMRPYALGLTLATTGLTNLLIPEEMRRQGLGTFLVGEALKQCSEMGNLVCEAQAMAGSQAAIDFYHSLGFREVDRGTLYRKSVS